jgi:hypothetical protein
MEAIFLARMYLLGSPVGAFAAAVRGLLQCMFLMTLLMNIVARKRGFADEAALPLTKLLVIL